MNFGRKSGVRRDVQSSPLCGGPSLNKGVRLWLASVAHIVGTHKNVRPSPTLGIHSILDPSVASHASSNNAKAVNLAQRAKWLWTVRSWQFGYFGKIGCVKNSKISLIYMFKNNRSCMRKERKAEIHWVTVELDAIEVSSVEVKVFIFNFSLKNERSESLRSIKGRIRD